MASNDPTTCRDEELIAHAARQVIAARNSGGTLGSGSGRGLDSFAAGDLAPTADAIPGYQLVGERQRGGQGVVYEAIQHGTRRRVAIKVLHERQIGGMSRARFEREIEILAQLRHPNIVTIHDSSRTGHRLFYVMDFIDGVPFDQFAAGIEGRDPRRILVAFGKICDAVHAAHMRGVMHRDLKPSNILLDPSGEPRVLDFGLAKWLDSADATAPLEMTATGQFLGSLLWAAPEQLEGAQDRVDLRSDVYSLGVILFNALTGSLPYPSPTSVSDVALHIRESEPVRPSTLKRDLNDELDTIILKCLQKDPERRYQTAGELGRDVQRYLAHEPIEAKRDSLIYFLRKRLRRHRVTVIATAAVLAASAIGLVFSLVFWRGAERQRLRAEQSEAVATRRADEARRVAEFQAALLERIDPQEMGQALRAAIHRKLGPSASAPTGESPITALPDLDSTAMTDIAREIVSRTLLDPAESEIASQFASQPAIEARLRDTLANVYRRLGRYSDAERQIRRALELRRQLPDEALADALNRLAVIRNEMGDVSGADAMQREALEFAERRHGPESVETATALDNLASLLAERSELDAAETLIRRALAIWVKVSGEEHADTLNCLNNLAVVHLRRGNLDEAESLTQRVLEKRRATLKPNDPLIAATLRNLARIQFGRDDFDSAEANLRSALELEQSVHGNEHPQIASSLNALAMVLMARRQLDQAEPHYRTALAMQERILGDLHPDTATTRGNLGVLLTKRGDHASAIPILRETLNAWTALYGQNCPDAARTACHLAEALLGAGDPRAAETLLRQALAFYESHPATSPDSLERTRRLLARAAAADPSSQPADEPR